jgi:hypothetical protein
MLTSQPTCPPGIAVHYDNSGNKSCGTAGTPATMADQSACNTDLYMGSGLPLGISYKNLQLQYTPNSATGGACSFSAAQDSSAVNYSAHDLVCVPTTEPCTGNQCTPSFGSQLKVCVAMTGVQSCPGAPFTVSHTVGGAATFTCTNNCSCSVDAGACTGTVKLYTAAGCMGTELDIPADNVCTDSGATSDTYASYAYAPNPLVSSCTSGGSSAAQNLALTNVGTICCTQ